MYMAATVLRASLTHVHVIRGPCGFKCLFCVRTRRLYRAHAKPYIRLQVFGVYVLCFRRT